MSMIQREVSGLVGAYIRAWVWGGVIGSLITLYAINASSSGVVVDGLHDVPIVDNCALPSGTYRGIELPCYDQQCLEAFGYYTKDRHQSVIDLANLSGNN